MQARSTHKNKQDSQRGRFISSFGARPQFLALFFIYLILSFPLYSANALAASTSISHNSGQDNIQGFLDANSDTWTVRADVSVDDASTIDPAQVQLEVASSQVAFSSCSSGSCEFQSILEDGISEGSYPFRVVLYDLLSPATEDAPARLGDELASDSGIIIADASAPSISFVSIEQVGSAVELDFTVTDEPSVCVGLEQIEVLDTSSSTVLHSIPLAEDFGCEFDYSRDSGTGAELPISLTGEGLRYIAIRATDRLGNSRTSSARTLRTDFVAPNLVSSSFELSSLNNFVGQFSTQSDVQIQVAECSDSLEVLASSEQITFTGPASCELEDEVACLWNCQWLDQSVSPSGSSLSASFTLTDEFANSQSATASVSYTQDTTAPQVLYFGTQRQFGQANVLASGREGSIIARFEESGSGISVETVTANLAALGGNERQRPDSCEQETTGGSTYLCTWEINSVRNVGDTSTSFEIALSLLEDLVGNEGQLQVTSVTIDGTLPSVQDIELFGVSAIGPKDYFQSHDDLLVELSVEEESGLYIEIDTTDIVADALQEYRHGQFDETGEYTPSERDGKALFDDTLCSRDEQNPLLWNCRLRVESIKSGYDPAANLDIEVFDTAGNPVADAWQAEPENVVSGQSGSYTIEILALDEETAPDFWGVSRVDDLDNFVDLDIAQLTAPRFLSAISLRRSNQAAQAVRIEVNTCSSDAPDAPALSRNILYGGYDAGTSPTVNLIMEFSPFDPSTVLPETQTDTRFEGRTIEYTCELSIYSTVSNTALTNAELQDVTVPVTFAYSEQGALDENVDELLDSLINKAGFQILDRIKIVNKIISVVNVITPFLSTLQGLGTVVTSVQEVLSHQEGPQAAAAKAACSALGTPKEAGHEVLDGILKVTNVLSCTPNQQPGTWYGAWQKGVLEVYNAWKGEAWTLFTNSGATTLQRGSETTTRTNPLTGRTREVAAYQTGEISNFRTTNSLFDNIYVSAVGLCVPGVLHNLEKLRQIHCVQFACLQNDVPAGVTTVAGCQASFEYLTCKYWFGELVGMAFPFTGLIDALESTIKNIVSDPIGNIAATLSLICDIGCTTGEGTSFCYGVRIGTKVLGMVNQVVGGIRNITEGNLQTYDYCKAAGIETRPSERAAQAGGAADASVTTDQIGSETTEASA